MAKVIALAENSEEKFDLTEIMQYRYHWFTEKRSKIQID